MYNSFVHRSTYLNRLQRLTANILVFVAILYAVFSVGGRSVNVGTDTENYIYFYESVVACECIVEGIEPIFAILARSTAILSTEVNNFFALISLVQFSLLIALARNLNRFFGANPHDYRITLLFLAISLLSPFFMAAQINVIRQGAATLAIGLAAIALQERRLRVALVWSALATGLHFSALLYVAAFPIYYLRFQTRAKIFVALVSIYAIGLSSILVKLLSDVIGLPLYSFVAGYGHGSGYRTGVRFDFLAFSLLPLIVSWVLYKSSASSHFRVRLVRLVELYSLMLLPFLMFGWGGYSDRYAFGAWQLLPAFGALFIYRFFPPRAFVSLLFFTFVSHMYFLYSLNTLAYVI